MDARQILVRIFGPDYENYSQSLEHSDAYHNELSNLETWLTRYLIVTADYEKEDKSNDDREGRIGFKTVGFRARTLNGSVVMNESRTGITAQTSTATVTADCVVRSGLWQYEVTIRTRGSIRIGWLKHGSKVGSSAGVGDVQGSYSYDGSKKMSNFNGHFECCGDIWYVGDVLSTVVNFNTREIKYFRNGRHVTTAKIEDVFLHPASTLSIHESAIANFGGEPFLYPQLGYEPLQRVPKNRVTQARLFMMWLDSMFHIVDGSKHKKVDDVSLSIFMIELLKVMETYFTDVLADTYVLSHVIVPYLNEISTLKKQHPEPAPKLEYILNFFWDFLNSDTLFFVLKNIFQHLLVKYRQSSISLDFTEQKKSLKLIRELIKHRQTRLFCVKYIFFDKHEFGAFLHVRPLDDYAMKKFIPDTWWDSNKMDKDLESKKKSYLNTGQTFVKSIGELVELQNSVLSLLNTNDDGGPQSPSTRCLFLFELRVFAVFQKLSTQLDLHHEMTTPIALSTFFKLFTLFEKTLQEVDKFNPLNMFYDPNVTYDFCERVGGYEDYLRTTLNNEIMEYDRSLPARFSIASTSEPQESLSNLTIDSAVRAAVESQGQGVTKIYGSKEYGSIVTQDSTQDGPIIAVASPDAHRARVQSENDVHRENFDGSPFVGRPTSSGVAAGSGAPGTAGTAARNANEERSDYRSIEIAGRRIDVIAESIESAILPPLSTQTIPATNTSSNLGETVDTAINNNITVGVNTGVAADRIIDIPVRVDGVLTNDSSITSNMSFASALSIQDDQENAVVTITTTARRGPETMFQRFLASSAIDPSPNAGTLNLHTAGTNLVIFVVNEVLNLYNLSDNAELLEEINKKSAGRREYTLESQKSLLELLDSILFIFVIGAKKQIQRLSEICCKLSVYEKTWLELKLQEKNHPKPKGLANIVYDPFDVTAFTNNIEIRDTLRFSEDKNASMQITREALKNIIQSYEKELQELSRDKLWIRSVLVTDKHVDQLLRLISILCDMIMLEADKGQLLCFVPDFYLLAIDCLCSSVFNYISYIVPDLEYKKACRPTLNKLVKFVLALHTDSRIAKQDCKDAIDRIFCTLLNKKFTLEALEAAPLKSRMKFVEQLLKSYEFKRNVASNWILMRIWHGCGFAFRYSIVPGTIPVVNKWTRINLDFCIHNISVNPSYVFQDVVTVVLSNDEIMAEQFANGLINNMNWAVSELLTMLHEVKRAAMRSETLIIEPESLRIVCACYDFSVAMLRVAEMCVTLTGAAFVKKDVQRNDAIMSRLFQTVFLIITRVAEPKSPLQVFLDKRIPSTESVSAFPITTACLGVLTASLSQSIDAFQKTKKDKSTDTNNEIPHLVELMLKECSDQIKVLNYILDTNTDFMLVDNEKYSSDDISLAEQQTILSLMQMLTYYERLRGDVGEIDEEDLCTICYSNPRNVVFRPCLHETCIVCIKQQLLETRLCFFCKTKIECVYRLETNELITELCDKNKETPNTSTSAR